MGCIRALLIAILVAVTMEVTKGFLPYDVQSTIIDLMEERDFTGLQKARFSDDNVRPIYRKDMDMKKVRDNIGLATKIRSFGGIFRDFDEYFQFFLFICYKRA